MPEQVGLQAVLRDEAFQKGLKRYLTGLAQMDTRTGQITQSAGAAFGGLGGALITGVGAGIGVLVGTLLPKLMSGLQQVASVVADVGKESIMTAARSEELGIIVQFLGQAAGYGAAELEGYVAQLRDAGLKTETAQNTVAAFTRYNLDLAKSLQLTRIAQGTASLANEDSSETMQALIDATLTQNTLMLRRRGIVINMGQVMDAYATAHGTVADKLTDTERAQAALDAVIVAGTPLIELYDKVMESASKQLRSMPRYIYELLLAAGTPFQTTFEGAVFLLVDFVGALTDAAREGGWLNVVLTDLGSTIQTLTAPLVGWGRTVIDIMQDVNSVFGSFKGPNLQALSGNIAAIQRRISELQPPDLASGWEKQVSEIEKLNAELGSSITRIWDDVNRAVVQATDDYNRQRARSDQDWIRGRERDLADHRDTIADMYAELEDRITDMQRDRARERANEQQRWREEQERALETHEEDMEDLRRDAGMAETQEEYNLIQSLIAEKEKKFKDEQALAIKKHREEQQAAEKEFQREMAQERRRVKERVAIAQLEFDQRRIREEEDRKIRLAREEQDFQLRTTRQNEEATRREADLKTAAAERTSLLQAEIDAGQKARETGYAAERASLLEQLAAAKREYAKALFELPFLHEDAAKESAKAYSRLSDLFAEQFDIEFDEIVKSWEEKDWGTLGLIVAEELAGSFNRWAIPKIFEYNKFMLANFYTAGYYSVFQMAKGIASALLEKPLYGPGGLQDHLRTFLAEIGDKWPEWKKSGSELVGSLLSGITEKLGDFWNAGWNIIKAFVEGFLWGQNWLRDVVRDVMAGAVRAALDALGIGSPSKIFLSIGENLSASLAEGIRSMGGLPAMEMQRVAAGTMHSVTNSVSNQNYYNLSVHTSAPVEPILSDFRMMQVIAG